MRKDTVCTDSGCGSCRERSCHSLKLKVWKEPSLRLSTTWAWPWNNSVSARRAVQILTACQRRLSTSTCWLSTELISDPTRAKLHKPRLPVNALGGFRRKEALTSSFLSKEPPYAGCHAFACWSSFVHEQDGKHEGEEKKGTASYPRNAA